ncbi:IMPACT family member YigZ [Aliarcobacter thereius]|uniref:IMPACT family protein n=1 Tax=Aliarcobacter thereius TaxID=544718 RepID=UPI0008291563|nr:YigZ family protein [Aliarcobacter thereius]OCL85499.1 IMPACT family member YigZ [Aliarcobacter thereius]TLT06492.1 YigZ family protein [Aliarcobacter thereius]
MKFVQKEFTAILDEKKSKFLAFLLPYKDFDKTMQRLKTEHPKAVHHVYAYRYLNEFDQIVENCSDDGEPRGTSGRPSLAVLSGANIINSAVIIVRYFGGIKLGTGGLVRAYSNSVNEVIKVSEFELYKKLIDKILECEYSFLSQLEYILKEAKINIVSQEFLMSVKVKIELTKEEFDILKEKLPREVEIL